MKPVASGRLPGWLLLAGVFEVLFGIARVGGVEGTVPPTALTAQDLKRMAPDELEQVFAHGQATAFPVGRSRGTILVRTDGNLPRLRVSLAGLVWKGKYFSADGRMTNQWAGFRAVSTNVDSGPSWYDGQPCIILEYPPGTAVFGNARDELREIAPGVFLARFYECRPCPKLQGYFVLELEDCEGKK